MIFRLAKFEGVKDSAWWESVVCRNRCLGFEFVFILNTSDCGETEIRIGKRFSALRRAKSLIRVTKLDVVLRGVETGRIGSLRGLVGSVFVINNKEDASFKFGSVLLVI